MINILFVKVIFWITFLYTPSTTGLNLKILGIKSNKGKIMIGIFKNDGGFPTIGKQYKGYELEINNYRASTTIHGLEKGTYAIGVCHDLNSNGKLDKNFLGIPTEPYGFSKNVPVYLSSPDFEDVSFYYDGSTYLEIKLDVE